MANAEPLDSILANLLMDHCNEMLLAVDVSTRSIVAANAKACRLLGYPWEDMVGMNIEAIESGLTGMFYWQEVANGNIQELESAESEFQRSDGSTMPVEKTVSKDIIGMQHFVLISARDITSRLHVEDELARMSARLKSTLESTADGILAVSGLGKIEGMNHRFSQMWGIPADILSYDNDQKVLDHLFHSANNPELLREFFTILGDDEHVITIKLNNGKIFDLRSCPQQATLGRVFSCNDVTARMQAEREAIAAKAEADRANKAKGTFLANMSHEIRTPMNAIIGLSQLALNKEVPDDVRDYLEKINISSESLLGILNDILDFSKIEAGKLSIEHTRFNLDTVLDNLQNMFTASAEEKHLELLIEVPPNTPTQLIGDALRIQQVLFNLVGNAVKFTAQGNVRVQLQLLEAAQTKARIRFNIKDTGIGIAQEDQAKLFQPFSQADTSITRRFGGSGLGLAISQKLVQLMGSDLHVESTPGQGATFSFDLTLGVASPEMHEEVDRRHAARKAGALANALRERSQLLSGARILVVEDNRINQQVVKEFLQLSGVIVDIANNGKEALQLLDNNPYDAVLMDVHMPEMGGVEATENIRRQGRFDTLPVIALTAGVTQGERDHCLTCGMNDFVSKPVNPEELIGVLCHWVKMETPTASGTQPELTQKQPQPVNLNDLPGFNLTPVLSLVGGKEELIIELLKMFRDDSANTITDLDACLLEQNYQAAHKLTHSITGSAGNMGATALHDAAITLDSSLRQGRLDQAAYANFRKALQETREVLARLG